MEIRICPMCVNEYSEPPAISRTKEQEEICPRCGKLQAINQFKMTRGIFAQTCNIHYWANSKAKMDFINNCLDRHMRFDWGDVDADDWYTNDAAISTDDRLLSAYNIPEDMQDHEGDTKILIITEADRSATTILFPSELN